MKTRATKSGKLINVSPPMIKQRRCRRGLTGLVSFAVISSSSKERGMYSVASTMETEECCRLRMNYACEVCLVSFTHRDI